MDGDVSMPLEYSRIRGVDSRGTGEILLNHRIQTVFTGIKNKCFITGVIYRFLVNVSRKVFFMGIKPGVL